MKNISWKTCFRVGISAFLLFLSIYFFDQFVDFLFIIFSAGAPILYGLVIAYILNILMSFYERHCFQKIGKKPISERARQIICMLAAMITLCGIIALVVLLVIPELFSCLKFLISEIPPAIEKWLQSEWVMTFLPENILATLSGINWQEYLQVFVDGIGGTINTIVSAVSSILSGVVTAFLSIIFAIYMLLGRNKLRSQCSALMHTYLRPKWTEKITYFLNIANHSFHGYIVGQCTEAVILGILCMIGMFLLRIPYAAMIGTLIGFTALIPIAGAYIGAAVGAVMILTVSPVKSLVFLIFLVILQQLEGNLIYPRVVGGSIGLPALWVLAAITIGGGLMGVVGMLLSVPVAATFYRIIKEDVARRKKQNQTTETAIS